MEARLAALPVTLRQQIQALALGGASEALPDASMPRARSAAPPPPPPFPITFLRPDPLLPEAASVAAAEEALTFLGTHGRQGGLAGGTTDAGVRGDTAAFIAADRAGAPPALAGAVDALVRAAAAALADLLPGPVRASVQVAAYEPGSPGYARHSDGGPGAPGRVATAVLYLGGRARPPGCGGELVLYPVAAAAGGAAPPALTVAPAGGRALAWAATTPHEVRPVTAGPPRVAVSAFFYAADVPRPPRPRPPPPHAGGRIFIAIPAFRDADARWTIHAAFAAAARPDRLSVGVAWEVHDEADPDIVRPVGGAWPGAVREARAPAARATGPASARRRAMALWAGEEFVLSIDAHTRFRRGWDDLLVGWWREGRGAAAAARAPAAASRLVLTAYPPAHEGWGPAASFPAHDLRPTVLCADCFGRGDGMLRLRGRRLAQRAARPIPSHFYAAGLAFAPAPFFTAAAPYDAWMAGAFFGEEADVWARAATAGWRAAAPPEAVVSTCYATNAGNRRGSAPPRTVGDAAAWAAREAACMAAACGGEAGNSLDPAVLAAFRARLGGVKSLAAVWAEAGVDWVGRTVSQGGRWGGLGAGAFAK